MKYLICKEDSKNPNFTKGLIYSIKEENQKYYLTIQDTGENAKIYYNANNFKTYFDLASK